MGRRRMPIAALAALAAALVWAPAAQATFHLISVREVYPGSAAHPDSGYVELQMYASGQDLVGGHALTVYNAGGTASGTFTFASNVSNAANQQTILVGDSGVQSAFGVAPDLTASGIGIAAAGGAACWAGSIDCVSWGNFSGSTPSASGSPADPSGIPDGMALRRTLEPGCPTLLEGSDDSNDSATDFADASPSPRNNSSPIAEAACTGPAAAIDAKPANPTNATGASFTYRATPSSGASFECKLDAGAFAACPASGIEYPGPLGEGSHSFQVRAKNASEEVGAPAGYSWRIDTTAPTTTIDSHPADPSPGASASFAYHASESGAGFECSLSAGSAPGSFSACPSSGRTYTGLADGAYTFEVRATDPAANQGAATAYDWEVDNSLADTTPPQTTILSRPPDPSESSTASFTYESNEPGSSFECRLDGAAFAACAASGIAYTGLANGPHTFLVRAVDPSANVDPTPAGYSFDVEAPVTIAPAPAPLAPAAAPAPGPIPQSSASQLETMIASRPRRRTRDRTPTVRFRSNVAGARFQCSVDRARFRACRSPFTTRRLRPGRHRIRVRAIAADRVDSTPAGWVFRVTGGRGRNRCRHGGHARRDRCARRHKRRRHRA
ncbi:MAG TPA: hypothetical protein VFG58_05495 [Solirubrobacterales bacterium]|nr:hypothetical protein [Solirubrobacterales bacterium]